MKQLAFEDAWAYIWRDNEWRRIPRELGEAWLTCHQVCAWPSREAAMAAGMTVLTAAQIGPTVLLGMLGSRGAFGAPLSLGPLGAPLPSVPEADADGWIAIGDRLPARWQVCLVTNGIMGVCRSMGTDGDWLDFESGKYPRMASEDITHWQPLPGLP